MSKILRIVFCILACLCVAATVVVGAVFGLLYCLIPLGCALVFAALMCLFKNEPWNRPKKQPRTDFMNSEEENARIRNLNNDQK